MKTAIELTTREVSLLSSALDALRQTLHDTQEAWSEVTQLKARIDAQVEVMVHEDAIDAEFQRVADNTW